MQKISKIANLLTGDIKRAMLQYLYRLILPLLCRCWRTRSAYYYPVNKMMESWNCQWMGCELWQSIWSLFNEAQFHQIFYIKNCSSLSYILSSLIIHWNFQSLYIFGRNVAEIPCFRSSFLYGIGGGFVGGAVSFLATSRTALSTNIGFATFFCGTIFYWVSCRYSFFCKNS